jgi:uncharacterized protein (DUF2147 family)
MTTTKLGGWKATIAVSMSNYIEAGSIIALATSLGLWQEYFGFTNLAVGLVAALSANAFGAALGAMSAKGLLPPGVVFQVAIVGAEAVQAADLLPTVAQQASGADAIVGDWKPTDMDVDIRIFPKDGKYVGGVVKAANPALVNTEMLREIQYDPASNTWRGEVFAIKRGQFVPMTIKITANGFEMVAGSGIMSKTVEWVRVQ